MVQGVRKPILSEYFNSNLPVAHREDAIHLAEIFRRYLAGFPRKKELILELAKGKAKIADIEELRLAMDNELVEARAEEKTERQLIRELEETKYEMEIRKINVLNYRFNREETFDRYIHELLNRLAAIIILELHIVEKLRSGPRQPGTLIENLKRQADLEERILDQIGKVETRFLQGFVQLMLGERVIARLYKKEKNVFTLTRVLQEKLTSGLTYDIAMAIFEETKAKIEELIYEGQLEAHPDVDLEFVNSPAFIEIAREKMQQIRGRMPSEQLIAAFAHVFREWYTQRDFLDI